MKRKRAEYYTCNGYKDENAVCRQCLPDPKIPETYAHRGGWKCRNIGARVKNVPYPWSTPGNVFQANPVWMGRMGKRGHQHGDH